MTKSYESERFFTENIEKESSVDFKKKELFSCPELLRSRVFLRLHIHTQKKLLNVMNLNEILGLIKFMDPDEVTDVLQRINSENIKSGVFDALQNDLREKVEFLLRFHPESAAGLMSLDYIIVAHNKTLSSVNKLVIKHEKRTGKFPTILIEKNGNPIGELPGHFLAIRSPSETVVKHIVPLHLIKYDESQEELIKKFKDARHDKVIVVDDSDSVIGIIYSDDILNVLDNKNKTLHKDLFHLGGVAESNFNTKTSLDMSVFKGVKIRLSWLVAGLFGAILMATFITLFEETLTTYVLIASFIPAIVYISGSLVTQTQTIFIRDLALLGKKFNAKTYFFRQFVVSFFISLCISFILFFFIELFWNELIIALAISMATFLSLIFTNLIAFFTIIGIKKLNFDPAFGSGPIAIIFSDMLSVFIYFLVVILVL